VVEEDEGKAGGERVSRGKRRSTIAAQNDALEPLVGHDNEPFVACVGSL
jgi:hypothetical protein